MRILGAGQYPSLLADKVVRRAVRAAKDGTCNPPRCEHPGTRYSPPLAAAPAPVPVTPYERAVAALDLTLDLAA